MRPCLSKLSSSALCPDSPRISQKFLKAGVFILLWRGEFGVLAGWGSAWTGCANLAKFGPKWVDFQTGHGLAVAFYGIVTPPPEAKSECAKTSATPEINTNGRVQLQRVVNPPPRVMPRRAEMQAHPRGKGDAPVISKLCRYRGSVGQKQ